MHAVQIIIVIWLNYDSEVELEIGYHWLLLLKYADCITAIMITNFQLNWTIEIQSNDDNNLYSVHWT